MRHLYVFSGPRFIFLLNATFFFAFPHVALQAKVMIVLCIIIDYGVLCLSSSSQADE